MSARTLLIYKIIIFSTILVLTGFIGYLIIVPPSSSSKDDNITVDNEDVIDINNPVANYCPYYFPENCQKGYLEGAEACVDFSDDVLITYFCCPQNKILNGGKCLDPVPTCASIGSSLSCAGNPVENSVQCSQNDATNTLVNCCRPGERVSNNGVTLKCVSTSTPDPTPEPTPTPTPTTPVDTPTQDLCGSDGRSNCTLTNYGTCGSEQAGKQRQICVSNVNNTTGCYDVFPDCSSATPVTPNPTTPIAPVIDDPVETPVTPTPTVTSNPVTNNSTTGSTTTNLPATGIEIEGGILLVIAGIILSILGLSFWFPKNKLGD